VKFKSRIRKPYIATLLRILLKKECLDVGHLLVENLRVLALGDTITEVIDVLGKLALANLLNPFREEETKHPIDVFLGDHLHSVAVGLNGSSITASNSVKRHSNCCHRCLLTAGRSVGNVGAWEKLAEVKKFAWV
jgi:hypothetical protein